MILSSGIELKSFRQDGIKEKYKIQQKGIPLIKFPEPVQQVG